jgi:hypothetical protein
MTYDASSRKHYESLSTLEGISILGEKYATLNAAWLVNDLAALAAFVDFRRGLEALKDHHRVLETLENERSTERRRDLMERVRAAKESS